MKFITFLICLLISTISFAGQIKVYTMEGCTYCHHLMEALQARHITFTEVPGGKKYDSFPVTEVNGKVIYGDNVEEVVSSLKSGK